MATVVDLTGTDSDESVSVEACVIDLTSGDEDEEEDEPPLKRTRPFVKEEPAAPPQKPSDAPPRFFAPPPPLPTPPPAPPPYFFAPPKTQPVKAEPPPPPPAPEEYDEEEEFYSDEEEYEEANARQSVEKIKEDARNEYKRGGYGNAAWLFEQAATSLNSAAAAVEWTNAAAAFMMLGADADVRHAEALCTRALELDPGYLRALLRRARARLALRKSTLAFADLRDLLSRKVCTQSTPAASRTIVDEARALLAAPAANAGAYASARAFPRGKAPPQHAARGWGAPPTARGRACAQAAPKAPPRAWWLIDDVSQRVVAWGRGRTLGQLLIDLPRLIPGTPAVVQPLVPGKVRLAYLHAAKALHPDKVRADAPDLVLRKEAFLLLKDLYERENQ